MKVLVVDQDGVGLDFCLRCIAAGHQVRWFVRKDKGERADDGDGLVEKIPDWVPSVAWADLIFTTGNAYYVSMLEGVRGKVFGPSVASAQLEIERGVGMRVLQEAGIDVPPYEQFRTLKDAQAHVVKTDERYVFKTLGDNADKSLSYVSKSPADMWARLQRWMHLGMNPKGPVMLQQHIDGIEIGVSGWFGPGGWVDWWTEHIEHKKLMSGDYGPNTGETGTVQQYVDNCKLADDILVPLTRELHKRDHCGDLAVNTIVDSKGKAWPLEFTARAGWPAFFLQCATHEEPVQWMLDLLKGKNTLEVSTDVATGVLVAQPDFPYSKATGRELGDIPVFGLPKNRAHIHPVSIKMGEVPQVEGGKLTMEKGWVTAGDYVMVVSGLGKTVTEARESAYSLVENICIPNAIVRDDIGEKLEEQLPVLHKHGYALGMQYA